MPGLIGLNEKVKFFRAAWGEHRWTKRTLEPGWQKAQKLIFHTSKTVNISAKYLDKNGIMKVDGTRLINLVLGG